MFEKGRAKAPNPGLLQYNLARISPARASRKKPWPGWKRRSSSHGRGRRRPYELLAEVLKKLGKERSCSRGWKSSTPRGRQTPPLGYFLAGQYRRAGSSTRPNRCRRELVKKKPLLEGYVGLVQLYRKANRTDALLGSRRRGPEKRRCSTRCVTERKAISDNAPLLASLVQLARQRLAGVPEARLRHGVGRGMLALEGSNTPRPASFSTWPSAARPKEAGELLLIWGVACSRTKKRRRRPRSFQRGIDQKALPRTTRRLLVRFAGALASAIAPSKPWPPLERPPRLKKNSPRYSPAAEPGCCTTPSETKRRLRPTAAGRTASTPIRFGRSPRDRPRGPASHLRPVCGQGKRIADGRGVAAAGVGRVSRRHFCPERPGLSLGR